MKLLVIEQKSRENEYTSRFTSFFSNELYEVHKSHNLIDSMNQMYKGAYDIIVAMVFEKPSEDLIHFLAIAEERKMISMVIVSSDNLGWMNQLPGVLFFSTTTELQIIGKNLEIVLNQKMMIDDKCYVMQDQTIIDINNLLIRDISGKEIKLTRAEARILDTLVLNRDKALTRQEIIERSGLEKLNSGNERSIDVHIKNIRSKLSSNNITSVRGIGYRWLDNN